MNLVIALLSTNSYLTAEKIRKSVAGYADSASDEAFSRMFERDKNELRDLGIPLETGKLSSFDATEGYRINQKAYALPPVELTPEESASVAVATQLWQSPEMVTATQSALLKLRAAGVDVDSEDAGVAFTSTAALPGLRGSEEVLRVLLAATDSGRVVQFEHRPSRNEPYRTRTVEPWGVVTHRGRWYLVGHDRDRDDTRTFRLSRIAPGAKPVGPAGEVTGARGGQSAADRAAGGRRRPDRRAGHGVDRAGPSDRAAPPGHLGDAAGVAGPARGGDHRRHRHVRPAGPGDRQLRHRRGRPGARVAARGCAGPAARPGTARGWCCMSQVSNRLVRLLNMVPYFQANPRVTRDEAAAALGVTRKQLDADLDQLWMCGLPGYGPGDLIDFDFTGDTIEVTFTAGVEHPLRLTSTEATGILVALRALLDVPGMVDPQAARSAIAKIESAAGTAAAPDAVAEDADEPESASAAAVRDATRAGKALALEYHSASHDTVSSRVVDPIRVVLVSDHSYLEAWCRSAEGVRLFRFDRIVDARVLDEPAAPPAPAVQAGPGHRPVRRRRRGSLVALVASAHRPLRGVDVRLLPVAGASPSCRTVRARRR